MSAPRYVRSVLLDFVFHVTSEFLRFAFNLLLQSLSLLLFAASDFSHLLLHLAGCILHSTLHLVFVHCNLLMFVCALMIALARQLDLDEDQVRQAGVAGLLHDIGKMAIPMNILNKPGALTDDEFMTLKSHPTAGHKMLLGTGVDDVTLDVCLHHHEKIDGSGYPHRLAGEGITLFARMGAVCDVYDAITSDRPYKRGWCPAESMRKMAEWQGHFDQRVFQAFVKRIGIYPVGTFVRLKSGLLGVVLGQTEKSLLKPRVKVIFSTKSMTYIPPETLNLSRPGLHDEIVGQEDPSKWGIKHFNEICS